MKKNTQMMVLCLWGALLSSCGGGASGGGGSSALQVIANTPDLTSEQALEAVRGLSETDKLSLSLYGALSNTVYYKACQLDNTLQWKAVGTTQNCASAQQLFLQESSMGMSQQTAQNAESQRQTLLTSIRCSTGELDQASCGAYGSGVNNYNNTSDRVGDGIVGRCRVGIDPDCY